MDLDQQGLSSQILKELDEMSNDINATLESKRNFMKDIYLEVFMEHYPEAVMSELALVETQVNGKTLFYFDHKSKHFSEETIKKSGGWYN